MTMTANTDIIVVSAKEMRLWQDVLHRLNVLILDCSIEDHPSVPLIKLADEIKTLWTKPKLELVPNVSLNQHELPPEVPTAVPTLNTNQTNESPRKIKK